jgi:hypothetical protein
LLLAVLSDEKRRALYDAGMYDPLDDDQEEVEVINLRISPCSCRVLSIMGGPSNSKHALL